MNKTAIEWTDYTWNPITGCLHGCPYCYARKISERFTHDFSPKFHPERLEQPKNVKKPSSIFCGSMTDMFGYWVEKSWFLQVMAVIRDTPRHIYIILTKNPGNIDNLIGGMFSVGLFPKNLWIGVSVENQEKIGRIDQLRKSLAPRKFVSFEPLLGEVNPNLDGIDWVIVGGQTNPDKIPKREWVANILKEASIASGSVMGIPVFLKDNLHMEFKEYRHVRMRPMPR